MRALAAAFLAMLATAAEAQIAARFDLGIGGAGNGRPGAATLWSIAPSATWETGPFRFGANAEYGEFAIVGQGGHGRLEGSWFPWLRAPVLLELTGQARASALHSGSRGQSDGGARLHLAQGHRGLWAGAQAGADSRGPTVRWEAAAWRRFGDLSIQLQGSQTSAIGLVRRDGVAPDTLTPRPDTLLREQVRVHTDLGAWIHWQRGSIQLAGALGRRFGVIEPAPGLERNGPGVGDPLLGQSAQKPTAVTWWMLEGRLWFTEQIGLLASGGYQPPDGSLRTPGGRFLRLGLSAALPRGRREARPLAAPRPPAVEVKARADGFQELLITAPRAREVELMADFTDWQALPLVATEGGRWRLRLRLLPGVYGVNVRYDRGPWVVPAGLATVRDEFGGETGLLVVR